MATSQGVEAVLNGIKNDTTATLTAARGQDAALHIPMHLVLQGLREEFVRCTDVAPFWFRIALESGGRKNRVHRF